jgi:hypothetical protein
MFPRDANFLLFHERDEDAIASPASAVVEHVQAIAYLKRKPELSLSQFYAYWEHIHAKKVLPWAEKHGVLSYRQVSLMSFISFYTILPSG